MKLIAGCVIALAMTAGTGIAQNPTAKHDPAHRSTVTAQFQSGSIARSELVSQVSRIDRSRKGDRITVARAAKNVFPQGCEPPFSPLAKLPSPNFNARGLT
jgi:hypothetical protein